MKTHQNKNVLTVLLIATLFITACSSANEDAVNSKINSDVASVQLDVYKSPACGCCGKWIDHIKEEGFLLTKAHDINNLEQLKDEKGVPKNYRSCHTTITKEGYIFEGHIPANIIKKFLTEKPTNAKGLVVPGMPVGSPGMAYQNRFSPYDVLLINNDGTLTNYAKVKTEKEQFE